MRQISIALLFLLAVTGHGLAQGELTPDPSIPPERVVEIQLDALQRNDSPAPDAGISQTWAFAHPDNKRNTGPLERFAEMIKSPSYRLLLNHRSHEIKSLDVSENLAIFVVTIITADDRLVAYEWHVSKVASGPEVGAWMTIRVSPPEEIGRAT